MNKERKSPSLNVGQTEENNLHCANNLGDAKKTGKFDEEIKNCNYIIKNKYDDLKVRYDSLITKFDKQKVLIEDIENTKLRLHADMENIRTRSNKEVVNTRKFALSTFVKELLPVLDSMEKGISMCSKSSDINAIVKGTELTLQMLIDILRKFEIFQIDPKNDFFDPNKHEAMAMQSNDSMSNNQILSVFQKGYELNSRVIRPARVLVVKNS
jgi:molecular chaperone GrpE